MVVCMILCLGIPLTHKPCFKYAKVQALTKVNSQNSKDKNNMVCSFENTIQLLEVLLKILHTKSCG